ncbi:MAG: hypothetical protein Q9M92_17280 [Enterobacterales bacterium]|nr:hypothetical protein [Enterobacterales bacterium]
MLVLKLLDYEFACIYPAVLKTGAIPEPQKITVTASIPTRLTIATVKIELENKNAFSSFMPIITGTPLNSRLIDIPMALS